MLPEANDALVALATQLYVRLRREANRIIDVVWLLENADYAREVVGVIRAQAQPETAVIAARSEALRFGAPETASAGSGAARGAHFIGEPF